MSVARSVRPSTAGSKQLVHSKDEEDAANAGVQRPTPHKQSRSIFPREEVKEASEPPLLPAFNSSNKRKSILSHIDQREVDVDNDNSVDHFTVPVQPGASKRGKRSRPLPMNPIHRPHDQQPTQPIKEEVIEQPMEQPEAAAPTAPVINHDQMMMKEEEVKESVMNNRAVVDAASLVMDEFRPLKQSDEERSVNPFAPPPKPTKSSPPCKDPKCDQPATHICITLCGLLCQHHVKTVHQRPLSVDENPHQCISLKELDQKNALKRVDQAQTTFDVLEAKLEQFAGTSHSELQYAQCIQDGIERIDSQRETIDSFLDRISRISNNLEQQKQFMIDSFTRRDVERHHIINVLQTRRDDLTQSGLLSGASALLASEDDFERLVFEEVKCEISPHLQHPPAVRPPHPIVAIIEELTKGTILPSLSSLASSLYEKLESFLNKSHQSLVRQHSTKATAKLLYKSILDGWTKDDFIHRCQEKSHTLILVDGVSEGHQQHYLFGAYLDPAWPTAGHKAVVPDASMKSFIFSLTNPCGHPFRLSLTAPTSACQVSSKCIGFGLNVKDHQWCNMMLFFDDRPGNHPQSIVLHPQTDSIYAYQLDEDFKKSAPKVVQLDHKTFSGSRYCGANQIEVYQFL